MTQGITGTFAINGTEFLLEPTEHGWVEAELIGINGNGRPVYPAFKQYEMSWDLMSMDVFSQLVEFYNYAQTTGSLSVDLPKYATSPYQFYSYSGCYIKEPTVGKFFIGYVSDVSLLVLKVKI